MYFIQVLPEQINAKMAILKGQVLAHLTNYMTIYDAPPTSLNADFQVFAIDPLPADVNRVMDGGKEKIYLWRGDKGGRYNEFDLVSVPILPVDVAMRIPKPMAVDVARSAFSDLPEPLRLAGVLLSLSDDMLKALPANTSQLKSWAENACQQSVAAAGA